jgi:HEAT repeat protein
LQGTHSQSELAAWAARATAPDGASAYLRELLETGQLDSVTGACRRNPAALLESLVALAGDLDTPFAVRVGVGAVLEDLAETGLPAAALPALQRLAASEHPQVRADAAHFLGLDGSPSARQTLAGLARDPDAEVREIATESLASLETGEG